MKKYFVYSLIILVYCHFITAMNENNENFPKKNTPYTVNPLTQDTYIVDLMGLDQKYTKAQRKNKIIDILKLWRREDLKAREGQTPGLLGYVFKWTGLTVEQYRKMQASELVPYIKETITIALRTILGNKLITLDSIDITTIDIEKLATMLMKKNKK